MGSERRVRGDRGVSLAELLVVMLVSSVVLVAVGTTFATSLRLTTDVNSRTATTADARLAAEAVARRLRVAIRPPSASSIFLSAGPTAVRFYASLSSNGGYPTVSPSGVVALLPPTLVDYRLDPVTGCLRETLTRGVPVTAPDGSVTYGFGGTSTTRCLAVSEVVTGAPLFSYYTTGTGVTPLSIGAGSTDPVLLDTVRSVAVDLRLHEPSRPKVRPMQVRTRVFLANRYAEDVMKGIA